MTHSTISLGLGLGGGKAATSSGRSGGGGAAYANLLSASFDGTDDVLDCGDDSSLEPANVTISAWFKATGSIGNYNYILSKLGAYYGTFHLRYRSNNKFNFFIGLGTSGANVQSDGSGTYTLTDWNHVVLTYDKTNIKLYVNGSEDFSQAETRDILYFDASSPYSGKTLTIGKGPFTDPAEGLIDEVSYFGSALSASDISAMYNSGTPTDISSLNPISWWRMGENDSGSNGATIGTVTDQGSGGNNGTGTNGATYSSTTPSAGDHQLNYPGGIWSSSGSTYFIGTAPTMHFDASIIDGADPNNNPSNGAAVSTWGDRSGNGTNYDASQSNASEQPVYTASGPGSQPTITWNGDKLDLATTWSKSGSITGVFISQSPTNDHKISPTGYTAFANQLYNEAFPSFSADFFGGQQATNVSDKRGFNYITARRDGTSATLFEQGGSSILGPLTRSATIYIDRLGDASGSGRYNHLGTISEIMVFDSALSTSELNTIRLYIANKYSISTSAFS